jgi:hypothetical protein
LKIATGLTVFNLILLFFFDDGEMKVDRNGVPIEGTNTFYHKLTGKRYKKE